MYKLFTPSQATEMLGVVDPMLRDLQGALHDALRLQRERLAVRPESLRARQLTTELTFVIESAQLTKAEFDRLGVFVKDLEGGVVDRRDRRGPAPREGLPLRRGTAPPAAAHARNTCRRMAAALEKMRTPSTTTTPVDSCEPTPSWSPR